MNTHKINQQVYQTIQKCQKQRCSFCPYNPTNHSTKQCTNCIVMYYLSSLQNVSKVLQNGIQPQKRQLGKAVYVSDEPLTMIKYAQRNRQKYPNPCLIKLIVNLKRVRQIENAKQVRKLDKDELHLQKIQAIKYPLYKLHGRLLYVYGLYKADYSIIGFSLIQIFQQNLPKNQNTMRQLDKNKKYPEAASQNKNQIEEEQQSKKMYYQKSNLSALNQVYKTNSLINQINHLKL